LGPDAWLLRAGRGASETQRGVAVPRRKELPRAEMDGGEATKAQLLYSIQAIPLSSRGAIIRLFGLPLHEKDRRPKSAVCATPLSARAGAAAPNECGGFPHRRGCDPCSARIFIEANTGDKCLSPRVACARIVLVRTTGCKLWHAEVNRGERKWTLH
jgi:hypothetical protein